MFHFISLFYFCSTFSLPFLHASATIPIDSLVNPHSFFLHNFFFVKILLVQGSLRGMTINRVSLPENSIEPRPHSASIKSVVFRVPADDSLIPGRREIISGDELTILDSTKFTFYILNDDRWCFCFYINNRNLSMIYIYMYIQFGVSYK